MENSKFKYPTFKPFDYDCTTVYPSDYDGLTDVLKTLINHSKIQNKKQGNKDRKSTRLNSSHVALSRMPSSA